MKGKDRKLLYILIEYGKGVMLGKKEIFIIRCLWILGARRKEKCKLKEQHTKRM